MRVFSSEPLYLLKNRLKKSLINDKRDDLDYQESWMLEEDGALPNKPVDNREPNH